MPTKRKIRKPEPEASVFLTAPAVCQRYGVSHMWLQRKLASDPSFPRPNKLGGRVRFFKIMDLEIWSVPRPPHKRDRTVCASAVRKWIRPRSKLEFP
jgi:predicted DNA-binding transcriptional regulator AlpA